MSVLKRLTAKVWRESLSKVRSKYKGVPQLRNNEPRKRGYVTKSNDASSSLQVKVTSRDMIKPSLPTPHHMNSIKLSLLDQMASTYHTPILLFYQNNESNHTLKSLEWSRTLTTSLCKTLVDFYPLAGRIQGNESINCEDQGVEFCEAYVSQNLTNVIQNPNVGEMKALLPFETIPNHKNIVLSIQLNHFLCGGSAIGVRLSHKIADGGTAIDFIRAWATTARGHRCVRPEFNGASLFPPIEELNGTNPGDYLPTYTQKLGSKTLVFDNNIINELKAGMGNDPGVMPENPTSVEVVSAFIWKHMMSIPEAKIDTAMHAMSFRTMVVPPIPNTTFGNFGCTTSTSSMAKGPKTEYPELVSQLRKAVKKIDDSYLKPMLKGDQRLEEIYKERDNLFLADNKCLFSNWSSFPVYEVNFGMGSPVWVCDAASPVKNMVNLWSTKCGQGIQACIHMLHDDISTLALNLQHHPHLSKM